MFDQNPTQASRRALLMGLAAAATPIAPAFATALGGLPAPAAGAPDPIFPVIRAHHQAMAHETACAQAVDRVEETFPRNRMTWHFSESEDGRTPPEGCTDAPEWIEAQQKMSEAYDLRADAIERLLTTEPTTLAGAVALLEYVGSAEYPWSRGVHESILFRVADSNRDSVRDAALAFPTQLGATMRSLIGEAQS